MQSLRAIESLAPVVSSDKLNKELWPHVLKLATDGTPNIRFNVAKCMNNLLEFLSPKILEEEVRPSLDKMLVDSDDDVKYYAKITLDNLNGGNEDDAENDEDDTEKKD